MQGKKVYQEKLFNSFQLSDRVPEFNFYRRLRSVFHLDFLYGQTRQYYGHSGQHSIDPVVFFKLCLVGYLENIISDAELKSITSRQKNWSINQDQRPGAKNKGSGYTSNKTHYSPTDPDARISVKPDKARKLNYSSQLSPTT